MKQVQSAELQSAECEQRALRGGTGKIHKESRDRVRDRAVGGAVCLISCTLFHHKRGSINHEKPCVNL